MTWKDSFALGTSPCFDGRAILISLTAYQTAEFRARSTASPPLDSLRWPFRQRRSCARRPSPDAHLQQAAHGCRRLKNAEIRTIAAAGLQPSQLRCEALESEESVPVSCIRTSTTIIASKHWSTSFLIVLSFLARLEDRSSKDSFSNLALSESLS
jgi:hypothetical protein